MKRMTFSIFSNCKLWDWDYSKKQKKISMKAIEFESYLELIGVVCFDSVCLARNNIQYNAVCTAFQWTLICIKVKALGLDMFVRRK